MTLPTFRVFSNRASTAPTPRQHPNVIAPDSSPSHPPYPSIGHCLQKLRAKRRHDPVTGAAYPWLAGTTAMVNHYYVYLVDEDFGALFVKFCSYFPYNAKVCLNGHEYVKHQLARRGMGFEALDNVVARCDDPDAMQAIARQVSAPSRQSNDRRSLSAAGRGRITALHGRERPGAAPRWGR